MKVQETTFYEQLQNCPDLDLRDNRGKVHDMPFVLLGVTLGLLRKRDGNLSSLHRSMKNTNEELCIFLGIEYQKVISRSQLPRLLTKVNRASFERLLFDNYGIELEEEEKSWFAGDGKELRGSIEKGDKRGQAIVQLVRHEDREVLGQSFYNGKKESEKPCLRTLIKDTGAANQKITTDALHFNPEMTSLIAQSGGFFIIGLKNNQQELYADMNQYTFLLKPVKKDITVEKGHGRVEKRVYKQYDIRQEYVDKRWKTSNLSSLIEVQRERLEVKTGKESFQTDLYMTNIEPDGEDCFAPIRNHWSVEVNNHVRDVTLKEDQLKTKKSHFQNNGRT